MKHRMTEPPHFEDVTLSAPVSESPAVEPLLLEVSDVVNSTLDLDASLSRVAELVRKVIDYEIFAIFLLNPKTQELFPRFQIGYPASLAETLQIKVGQGVIGQAAEKREAVLVRDVRGDQNYVHGVPNVGSELAIPLIVKKRVIGVIDIEAREANYFTEEHARLLTLVASRMAVAIENARLHTRTSRQARSLLLLNEISREMTSILNLDQLLAQIAELLKRLIDYQMFSILLVDPSGNKLQHRYTQRFGKDVRLKHDIPLGRGLVGYAAQQRIAVVVPDVKSEPRYVLVNPETRSEMCVPLVYKDKVIGVIDLEHTRKGYFTEDHKRTMVTLAAQVAVSIENARLYEQLERQERRLERELGLAHELQLRLLPAQCPILDNLEMAAKFVPARAIGGDLYDFLPYTLSRLGIAIGDVSGKGAAAALYAALVSGIIRSHAAAEPSPEEMLTVVNFGLNERPIDAQFVALIYAVWDDRARQLHVANSGLPRPIRVHHGHVSTMQLTGMPLGLFSDAQAEEHTFQADPGDLFVFFSDGIPDARSRDGAAFGHTRIEEIILSCKDDSAQVVVDRIFHAVSEHAAGAEPFDDQSVVALRVKEGSNLL